MTVRDLITELETLSQSAEVYVGVELSQVYRFKADEVGYRPEEDVVVIRAIK